MPTPQGILDIHTGGLRQYSELSGGRKVRDFDYYHMRSYAAAGQYSLEFFRTDGAQSDFGAAAATHVSNIITAGKFDEPFLLLGISVLFRAFDATDANQVTDMEKVLLSGKLTLEINNGEVFSCAPVGLAGSPFAMGGYASTGSSGVTAGLYSLVKPRKFTLPIYCEENITLRAVMNWTTVQALVGTESSIGVFLHGQKFFKA